MPALISSGLNSIPPTFAVFCKLVNNL